MNDVNAARHDPTGRFSGRVAVVIGASRDPSIGRAVAFRLGIEGASVVINGRTPTALREAEDAMREAGIPVTSVVGSAGDEGVADQVARAAIEEFGRIDLVVNTVGGATYRGSPRELGRRDLLDTFELNTWTALAVVQSALAHGLAEGGGAVVNISSGTVNKTTPSMLAYAVAKSGLNAMTRTLARDLAADGVRVNGVAPGLTRTSATRQMWESDDGESAGSQTPLGRLTSADDIAAAVCFLLSDDAASITGITLDVDAGNHLQSGWTPITESPSTGGATPN
jgi:3-oxoacyl-[acyl-carrier protein] reductase